MAYVPPKKHEPEIHRLPLCEYEVTVKNLSTGKLYKTVDSTDDRGRLSLETVTSYQVISARQTGEPHFRKMKYVGQRIWIDMQTQTVRREPIYEYED